jgi:hypothetical protein
MVEKALHLLIARFREHEVRSADAMASGHASNYSDYRELVGLIRGLRLAMNEAQDLLRNFEDQEDE